MRAVTRDPASSAAQQLADRGAQPVAADLHDADALASAADGARLAFLHLPMSLGGPDGAGAERAAVDALRKAGVKHLVFNTRGAAGTAGRQSHARRSDRVRCRAARRRRDPCSCRPGTWRTSRRRADGDDCTSARL
ncbi:MAG: NmrA family NAD(P)-binding protein [Actinobacteria bacterium]|nr:NmrA family NAD(P)-binding protein [Actinomycetota bacterium]